MLTQVPFAETAGKTIRSAHLGYNRLIVTFADDTFAAVETMLDDDDGSALRETTDWLFFDPQLLLTWGLIGVGEVSEIEARRREKYDRLRAEQREIRRQTFEKLKAEFNPPMETRP